MPKRSNQKHGHRTKAEKDLISHAPAAEKIPAPEVDPDWHPVAKRWFEALAASGQSHFYEPSDWATAYVLAESISRELRPHQVVLAGEVHTLTEAPSGAALSAWLKGMAALLVTEGDRRRMRVELQQPEAVAEEVASLDEYRRRLGAG